MNTYRCYRLYLEIFKQLHCSLQFYRNVSAISKLLKQITKNIKIDLYKEPLSNSGKNES